MINKIQQLIDEGLSSYQIAKVLGKPRTTIQSQIEKFGLKTKLLSFSDKEPVTHNCIHCGDTDSSNFYGHKKNICISCFKKETNKRTKDNKEKAVALLGGCCSICGYNKSISALEFHHTDPSLKDKGFSNMTHWSFKRIEEELSTCILVCANCHREIHDTV